VTRYVYRGTGRDTLTPEPGGEQPEAEPDLRPLSVTQLGYDQIRRRAADPGCGAGVHIPLGTTDREGVVAWACRRCQAIRSAGDPTWR
jgi:hypothetical protein